MAQKAHILLVTFPGQGHINPSLQFAKSLVRAGALVTFSTATFAFKRMVKSSAPDGLSFATYSDGYDDGYPPNIDVNHYMAQIELHGSRTLAELIQSRRKEGSPFTCLVYTVMIPWVAEVARELQVPVTLLWNQPATVFGAYYYFFNGYRDVIEKGIREPSLPVELPGLPPLTGADVPSFLDPSGEHTFAIPLMQKQFDIVNEECNPKVLVNTFDSLEAEAFSAMNKVSLVGVGPLIPSAFLDGKDPSDTSFGGDLFRNTEGYINWLNSKEESSVIYVSFGTLANLSKKQMEEIARGLLDTGRPFLWTVKGIDDWKEEQKLSCMEELHQQGMLVSWCSQVEVLSHPSVGYFLTHGGWNSTLECLVSGKPMVVFPQWSDQQTNAKLVQDLWKIGVKVEKNGEGMVEGGEVKRCLELIMKGDGEVRRNAMKWKDLSREAVKEDGPSSRNLRRFVDEVEKLTLQLIN